jgi:hypothetical protein
MIEEAHAQGKDLERATARLCLYSSLNCLSEIFRGRASFEPSPCPRPEQTYFLTLVFLAADP